MSMPMCGGHPAPKEMTPDVKELILSLRSDIEAAVGLEGDGHAFEPVSFTRQVRRRQRNKNHFF